MPESVKDHPTRSHEYLFMFTKNERYLYDHEAVRERAEDGSQRNRRTVWSINTCNAGSTRIAAFPEALVEPCIMAATKPDDFVLDPFFGSGTVGLVARRLTRRYVGIELNPHYVAEAVRALEQPSHLPRRNGHRFAPSIHHELVPTLLETTNEQHHGAGHVPPVVSSTSAVVHHSRNSTC